MKWKISNNHWYLLWIYKL